MMKKYLAPSILAANFGNLAEDINEVNNSEADFIHVDVMDGCFVPNISFGFPVMELLQKIANKPLDVHLMIVEPEKFVIEFARLGAHFITVHYETCPHLHRLIELIKSNGVKAGVTVNPHTPVQVLEEIIPYVDMTLIMSVNPGFGGQKFIPTTLDKVAKLKAMRDQLNPGMLIEIDGGVSLQNADQLYAAGVDVLVAGSSVFQNGSIANNIKQFKEAGNKFA
ncbi:MAG: ribulose-phosphate 3-epimerase [Bacteroidetes bacterium]|nr:ribulose-phosphate 3-epimerase [Bacteroidota bacterium]